MKSSFICFYLLCLYGICFAQIGTVADIDGNSYPTIIIGNQEWMSKNLKVTRYNNGDSIITGLNDFEWITTSNGAFGVYPHSQVGGLDSQKEVLNAYGALYNWYAVADEREICPTGWRVPSVNDWQQLVDYLMTEYDLHNDWDNLALSGVGNALKSCRQVNSPIEACNTNEHPLWANYEINYGTDDFGFSALPGGYRVNDGIYGYLGWHAGWWSSTGSDAKQAFSAGTNNGSSVLFLMNYQKIEGFSIRCIKSAPPKVETLKVSHITRNSAIGGGYVTDNNLKPIFSSGLVWSTLQDPTTEEHQGMVTIDGVMGTYTITMQDLEAETTYYVRAFTTNSLGTEYGQEIVFTTPGYEPVILELSASSISHKIATLQAVVNPTSQPVTVFFDYGVTGALENTIEPDPNTMDGHDDVAVSAQIENLNAETTYYFRLRAEGEMGAAVSEIQTFVTLGTTDFDGNIYRTVIIGDQEWMAENLKVTRYNNGDPILTNLSNEDWANATFGAYAVSPYQHLDGLNSEAEVIDAYGLLYNGYAVETGNLCPPGWHIPSQGEMQKLLGFISDKYSLSNSHPDNEPNSLGNALKSCRQINSPLSEGCDTSEHPRWSSDDIHFGTDLVGLSILPSYRRHGFGFFGNEGTSAYIWSRTPSSEDHICFMDLYSSSGNVGTNHTQTKNNGFSVRCVKTSTPGVKTLHIINPDYTSAIGRGEVIYDGGSELTARGLVWSTNENPDLENHEGLVTVEGGLGAFSSEMVGLVSETTYYVRAYATNDIGTGYGEPYEFYAEPRVFFSSNNHTISGSYENLSTRYFEVGDVGWVAASVNEEYGSHFYQEEQPPGHFGIYLDNVAHADFNQNGLQDFVMPWVIFPHSVPREARIPISIYLNNGDGTFRMAPELIQGFGPVTFMPYRIKTADFNQNGRPDIIAGSTGLFSYNIFDGSWTTHFDPIPLLLSNDDGTYYDATANIEGQENGGLPEGFNSSHDLAVGDVTGNGYPDIYVGSVLLINDGTGMFKNKTKEMPIELRSDSASIMSSVIGDLNNDGIEDIVAFYWDNNLLNKSGYIWLSQDGDPSFENRQLIELPTGRYGPGTKFNYSKIIDINNNGLNDIIVAVTRHDPYYVGRTIQVIINKGNGEFVDETDKWVKFTDLLEQAHGEGQLYAFDISKNGFLDLIHSVNDWGNPPGFTIYLNTGDSLIVVDPDVLPFVRDWQIDYFPYGGPYEITDIGPPRAFPVDFFGNGEIGFISPLGYPAPPEHPSNQREQNLYSIIPTRPIPLVHINNALEAELIGHLNTLSDSGWVEESVDEINRILLDYKEAPVEEWRDVFFDYFKEFHLTRNLMAYITHQPFADTDPTVRENLQGGLFFALSKLQSEILSKENLADSLQSKPSLGEHLLLTNKLFFDFFLTGDSVFDNSLIVSHYKELFNTLPEYFKLKATIDTLNYPLLSDVKNQMLANLASYNYLKDFEEQDHIAGIVGLEQLTDAFRQTIWEEYSLLILDNNVLDLMQTEKLYEVLSLLPREYHHTAIITTDKGFDHGQAVYSTGSFSVLTVGVGEEDENIFPLDFPAFDTDRFTLSAVRGLLRRTDAVWIDQHPYYKDHKALLIERAGSDSLNYLQSGVDDGFYTWHPQGFFPSLSALYFVNSRQALNLAISRMHQNIKHPMDQFLFAAEVFGDQQQTWFYEIDGMGLIYKQAVDIKTNPSGSISEVTVSDNERYFFVSDEDNMTQAAIGVVVSQISCYNSRDGSISLVVAGDQGFTVLWDDGEDGLVRQNLHQGQYALVIKNDALGFEKELSFNLVQPELLEVDVQVSTNGIIELFALVSGGTPPYTYLWEDLPGQSSHTLTGVDYGTYTVHIADANDCKTSASITLEDPTVSVIDTPEKQQIQVYPNPATNRIFVKLPPDYQYQGILLTNQQGVMVKQLGYIPSDSIEIGIEGLTQGLYHLHVIGQNSRVVFSVMILR